MSFKANVIMIKEQIRNVKLKNTLRYMWNRKKIKLLHSYERYIKNEVIADYSTHLKY